LIIRSLPAPSAKRTSVLSRFSFRRGLLLTLLTTAVTLAFSGCYQDLYKFPEYNFAGRPVPPSLLANRVMVAFTTGSSGVLQILDALRNQRMNIQNTIQQFTISGYNGNDPITILNFPDELRGYVYANSPSYTISVINYGEEKSTGVAATLNTPSNSFAVTSDFVRLYSAQEETGQILISDSSLGASFALNLPNVYKVAVNQGDTVALAMTRNSNSIYRIVKLNSNSAFPPGAVDCEPQILPVYCVVPVPGAYFSLDGSTVYVLNCGQECGGGSNGGAGVSFIPQGSLQINNIPTSATYPPVVTNTVPIPGGVTAAVSDGSTVYLSGQQLQSDGLYAGNLTLLPLATLVPSAPISISDGTHTKMLLADDSTLWIGSQNCANGERAAQFAAGNTSQAANDNCLTRYVIGSAAILPSWKANTAYVTGQEITDGVNTQVVQTGGTSSGSKPSFSGAIDGTTKDGGVVWIDIGPTTAAQVVPATTPNAPVNIAVNVPYPNQNYDLTYYGSLTGLCWVQNLHKMYTAYGGQVHAFNTVDGSEINNQYITIQGTALDVAYIDATNDTAD
jgi:hypothetical protein